MSDQNDNGQAPPEQSPEHLLSSEEITDYANQTLKLFDEKVPKDRPGGALLAVLALIRAASHLSKSYGFPDLGTVRFLVGELELAEAANQARLRSLVEQNGGKPKLEVVN